MEGGEQALCLTLFYFWGSLLEDYCKWQSIYYLDGSRKGGELVVRKPLDCDMCAAVLDRKTKKVSLGYSLQMLRLLTLSETNGAISD